MHKTLLIISALISISMFNITGTHVYATVGGSEDITILGEDLQNHKIYYQYNYNDESGRVPDLYSYDINTGNLVIEQPNIATSEEDARIHQDKFINSIKVRLTGLNKFGDIKVSYFTLLEGIFFTPLGYSDKIKYWKHKIGVFIKDKFIGSTYVECYHNNNVKVLGSYISSDGSTNVIQLRYTGRWDEGGYAKDSLIILKGTLRIEYAEGSYMEYPVNMVWTDIDNLSK